MEIKILGEGCSKCKRLEKNLNKALKKLNIETEIIKEGNLLEIVSYGVMEPPGLVINDEVYTIGKIPSTEEIIEIIESLD